MGCFSLFRDDSLYLGEYLCFTLTGIDFVDFVSVRLPDIDEW